ncbi:MBL fold metallo-hydrolase [Rhizosphaericola mali]|uniref:MBL fold metallo-hydrolase n=1 Tax=Rhizosphaericola mali TaxID=2545455 RepID=A0A5P2G5T7_9BACT|nr:MBL fold metallo-hydrolase [Rhizosphaericola mali]QES90058.1 MBL fold metallo-hydrolase [Rhizosphaericola mali]
MNLIRQFGQFPDKKRKEYFKTLSNYKNGQFQNLIDTPQLAENKNMRQVMVEYFSKHPNTTPKQELPNVHSDLKSIPKEQDFFVWFGHSSYLLQTDNINFLIDPVFSGSASPIPGSIKSFSGSNNYRVADLPAIDYLVISHDHWDHLDFPTIELLKNKVGTVVCSLGVGQHFEYWGWDKSKIIEKSWGEEIVLSNQIHMYYTPARHFAGRGLSRNISLWTSYVLITPTKKIFLGGDSGYGPHFKEIGEKFGPFDFGFLECGQYNENWPFIHSLPKEIIQEAKELQLKNFIPVHNSKFKLSLHPWYEPLETITQLAEENNQTITTPKIGEVVYWNDLGKNWEKWWRPFIV